MPSKRDYALALLSGVLLILPFPQINLTYLAWLAIVPLLSSLKGQGFRPSFTLGMMTGTVYFTGTLYWVYHSMHYYGGLPLPLSILLLFVLSVILSLYIGAFAACYSYVSRNRRLPASLVVPVLWVTSEYIRTYTIFSFPWSSIGYSQYSHLTFIQFADITGIYGVSFFIAAVNGMIHDLIQLTAARPVTVKSPFAWPRISGVIIIAVMCIAAFAYGKDRLNRTATAAPVSVSIIQANIAQNKKWDPKFRDEVIHTLERLSTSAADSNPDLIVWPESALPFIFGYHRDQTEALRSFQKGLNTHLLFGTILKRGKQLANSTVLLSPDGQVLSEYDKIHLVPYGEYVPLKEIFPFVSKMVTAIGDFVHGKKVTVMETPFAKIGNLICYEIIFPGLVRSFAANGATMLVTITNDAWFGKTAAPYQHFSMAVFRAIENRVPVVRAANTGISGVIDSNGRVTMKSDLFVEAVLNETVIPGSSRSFYARYGDIFVWFCAALACLALVAEYLSRRFTGTIPR